MICVPSILSSVSMSHDKGLRLGFHTNEMNIRDKQAAIELHDSFGYLLFKPNEIDEGDIPKEPASDNSKTPGQRLRAAIYVKFTQIGGGTNLNHMDFEAYYRMRMEKYIDEAKKELDQ
jgi:hypothetical protein